MTAAPAPPGATPHVLPCTVYIGDTDAYQMMYHTNYLVYYARARADILGLGEIARLQRECGISLVERRILHVRFFDSARLGEECAVVTTLFGVDLAAGTLVFNHVFNRGLDGSGKTLNRAVVEVGFVQSDGTAVAPLPSSLGFGAAGPLIAPCTAPRVFGGAPARCPAAGVVTQGGGGGHVVPIRCHGDLCDISGRVQMHLILDQFERARSAGMGGPVTLQRCQDESDHIFVVGRMDHINVSGKAEYGCDFEVRSYVELKYRNVCIVFHHQLWPRTPDAGVQHGDAAAEADGAELPLIEAAVSVYSITAKDKSPVPVPDWLEKLVTPHLIKR